MIFLAGILLAVICLGAGFFGGMAIAIKQLDPEDSFAQGYAEGYQEAELKWQRNSKPQEEIR